jgi:hypothetical protein
MASEDRRVERIVLALGSEALAVHALETAAWLAKGLDTPLAGLLVENEQLLRLADLPSVLEMGFPSAHLRPVDRLEIERNLRQRAERARRMLADISARLALQWSLEVVRGDLLREALRRALPADLVVVWQGARYGEAFVQARARTVQPRTGPVALLADEGEADSRALRAAHALARELGSEVLTLVAATDAEAMRRVRAEHEHLLGDRQAARMRYVRMKSFAAADLGRLLRAERAQILIVPRKLTREEFLAYCAELTCPVGVAN